MLSTLGQHVVSINWYALGLTLLLSSLASSAYLLYVMAYRTSGVPALSMSYISHVATSPWLIAGFTVATAAVVLRMFLFQALGVQRSYFVLFFGYALNAGLMVLLFREAFTPLQWMGVLCIGLGTILIASE